MSKYNKLTILLLLFSLSFHSVSAQQKVLRSNNPADLWTSWEPIARPWFQCEYGEPFEKVRIFVSNVPHGGSYEREIEFGGTPEPIQWTEDLPTGTYDWFVFFNYYHPPSHSYIWSGDHPGPTFYVDRSAPNPITLNSNGFPVAGIPPPTYVNRTDLTFTWGNPGDAGSGVSHYQVSVNGGSFQNVSSGYSPVLTTGEWSFSFRAVDYMGHIGPETKKYTKIDISAPGFSPLCTSSNASTDPNPDWNKLSYVRFKYNSADAGSGVKYHLYTQNGSEWAVCSDQPVFSVSTGTYTWQLKVRDFVDLESSVTTFYARIDQDKPEININSPSDGYLTNSTTLAAAWTGSDEHSGVYRYHYMLDEGELINAGMETSRTLEDLAEGEHRLIVRLRDNALNEDQDTVNFFVDLTQPVITTSLTDHSVPADETCKAVLQDYLSEVTASDNYSSHIIFSQDPAAGTEITGALNTVTISAEDDAGNIATFSFNAEVTDIIAPVLSFAEDKELVLDENCEVQLPDYTGDAALGVVECTSYTLAQEPAAGTVVNDTTTVTITATDEGGNTGSCSFTVNTSDNIAPVIECPDDILIATTKSAKKGHIIEGTRADPVSVTDNCGELSVTNNYNEAETLDGEEIDDGMYTIRWTATDEFMNTATCSFVLTIAVGTEDKIIHPDIQLYPNPAGDRATIESSGARMHKLSISDIHGKKLMESEPYNTKSTIELDQLPAGMYILSIQLEGKMVTRMLLKE